MSYDQASTELTRAARVALQQRRYPEALLARLDMLSEADLQGQPWVALLQGRRLCRLHSRFAEATTLIDAALASFQAASDTEGELWALAEWLVMRYHSAEFAQGLAALPVALTQPMPRYLHAELLFGQFLCQIGMGQLRAAVEAGTAALVALDDEGDPWLQRIGRIQMLRNIAAGYHYLGESRRAVAAAEQATALAQDHADTADMLPWCLYELGLAYWRYGLLASATEALNKARRLAEIWQHHELWRWAVAAQGHVLRDQDRLEAALAAYQLANFWGEDPEGPTFLQLRQGRLAEARWSCEMLGQIHTSPGSQGDRHFLLGLIELKSGKPAEALHQFDAACIRYASAEFMYAFASVQLYRAAAGMALQHPEVVEQGLQAYLAHAAAQELLTCSWWLPETIEPLLIYAARQGIEAEWAQRLLTERFVGSSPTLAELPGQVRTELEIASRMQLSLLPTQPPLMPDLDIAAVVQPAAEIGGDFVGYFPAGAEPESGLQRQIGIAVGDISGKGLGAALLLSGTVVALNTVAAGAAAPAQVARALHEAMYPYTSRSRMTIAFCYNVLTQQRDGWLLRTVGAGAIAPLLRQANGTCSWIETAGFPLGTFAGAQWPETQHALAPGDTLLLFSDGIVEAMNEARELFGFERLVEVVASLAPQADAHTTLAGVLAAVAAHTGTVVAHDDITLIVVRVLAGTAGG